MFSVCVETFTMVDVKGLNIRSPLEYVLSLYLPKVRFTPASPSRTTAQLLNTEAEKNKIAIN
jgi:hypothetical protein